MESSTFSSTSLMVIGVVPIDDTSLSMSSWKPRFKRVVVGAGGKHLMGTWLL